MAATTKLIVWNAALRELGAAPLTDTTSANTRQYELNAAWDHAVEDVLSQKDWAFTRRRSTLAGVADTSFPPYSYRASKPSDYLRKAWVKANADDEFELDHAEVAANIYLFTASGLLEYISDHADNYDPANWPPHFTRALTLYLAARVAPKLARAGAADLGRLESQYQTALSEADDKEAVFLTNTSIPANRQPVMTRAMEMMGAELAGSVAIHSHAAKLRWHMNRAWAHAVKYVLEQGAWNFATKRAYLSGGIDADTLIPAGTGGVVEGYSVGPGPSTSSAAISGYEYGYALPDDYLHKIWIKAAVTHEHECSFQIVGRFIFCDHDPAVMEYVATDATITDPAYWSATFTEAVAAYLALKVTPELIVTVNGKGGVKVDGNALKNKLEAVWRDKLSDAQNNDAIQQAVARIPTGRFLRSRGSTYGSRWGLR